MLGVGLLLAGIPSRTPIAPRPAAPDTRPLMTQPVGPVAVRAAAPGAEPAGRAESRTFFSTALGRQMPYLIYLPPGYDGSDTRYPVLYLLHGLGGSYTEWYSYGVFDSAERLIQAATIPPVIIALPEGERGYWVDHADGGPAGGTYVARDFVQEIDGRYRTLADGAHRAIGGMSMGGYGALELAMLYPGEFRIVGAEAPTLHGYGDAPEYFGDFAYFRAHDPSTLVAEDPDSARALTISLEVGTSDAWLPVVTAFHQELLELGVQHEWNVYSGGHTSESWAEHVDDDLHFYSAALGGVNRTARAAP